MILWLEKQIKKSKNLKFKFRKILNINKQSNLIPNVQVPISKIPEQNLVVENKQDQKIDLKAFVKKMEYLKINPKGEIKIKAIIDDKVSEYSDLNENKGEIMVNRKIKIVDSIKEKKNNNILIIDKDENEDIDQKDYEDTHKMMNILNVYILFIILGSQIRTRP